MRTGQLRADIPTSDARRMFQQRNIFIFIRCFQKSVILRSRHLRIQIRPLDMQTENRRVFLLHQILAYIDRLIKPFEGSRRQSRKHTGSSMFQVCHSSSTESLLRRFRKIMTTTSVRMHTHESRYDCHPTSINHRCTDNRQITVGHL